MSLVISTLQSRYLNSCKKYKVAPNPSILSWFHEAKIQKSIHQKCDMVISLDDLKGADFSPLIEALETVEYSSDIDAIDIIHKDNSILHKEMVWSLVRALNSKLGVLELREPSFLIDFLSDSSMDGLSCKVLNLRSSVIRELNLERRFNQLHTLNLDLCTSLKDFSENCFASVPNLSRISLCGTSIGNLWNASGALAKLRSLVELRFQNCLCCEGTGPCPIQCREIVSDLAFNGMISGHLQTSSFMEQSAEWADPDEIPFSKYCTQDRPDSPTSVINHNREGTSTPSEKYISAHPSPICFEKHYRVFMISSLPGLAVLDNLPITKSERENAKTVISKSYEYLPYKRRLKENVVTLLHNREGGICRMNQRNSKRSICAAKFGSYTFCSVSSICHVNKEERKSFRPRQFEYHPSDPSLMVFGTMDGEIVVLNHESNNIVGYVSSLGDMNSVLGLCWLKKYPNKFLSGSDNGSLRLYDINHMQLDTAKGYASPCNVTFKKFEQLTSVHVNSTDHQFLTSGCSGNVALYDIGSGKCVQSYSDMHKGPINVAKFANHSPSMFVTSSFDQYVKMWDVRQKPIHPCYSVKSSRGNVMVCFSPDDHHLLVSAVDNEVKQLMVVDGRLHLEFDIASTGSAHNYTRSYYMSGRDYVISGSSDESVVRICCAQTGRRLKDVYMEAKGSGSSMFVQSLRGDPFRHFEMAVLGNSTHPCPKSVIIKVNLLQSANKNGYHCGRTNY